MGQFVPDATILLDNRVHDGVVGYGRGAAALRQSTLRAGQQGWIAAPPLRTQLPEVSTPTGEVVVQGLALPPGTRYFELSGQTVSGTVWQNLKFDHYQQRFGLALQPLLLQQHNDLQDGLLRAWKRPDTGVDTHRAYALQWFVMSAVIAIIYLVLHVRRKKI